MIRQINKHRKIICYSLAVLIPVIFMLIISNSLGFYPFGNVSPLVADTDAQFVSYIAYLKSVFNGNNDLLYTLSKTIGGDMAGFTFYYLGNPFMYLLILIPNEALPAGILFMIIIMMSISSLTFNIMINRIFGFRWSSLIYSVSYAFMGYFMGYFNFIIYFFNLLLLPLIIMGLYDMFERKKISFKYIIFLALSIISNYYIGYMTCVFCLLFFIYLYVVKTDNFKPLKQHVRIFLRYIGSTLLAVMLSAFALFTVLCSLRGQKITEGSFIKFPLGISFYLRDVFSGLYTAGFNGNISDGMPLIYVGTVATAFLFLYFLNNEIKLKEKIVSAIFMLIMLLSFNIKFLNVMWHGFAEPVGFPYRNSFFLSFILLLFSYKGFVLMKQGTRKYHTLVAMSVFVLYSAYMYISNNEYVGIVQIILTGTFLVMIFSGVYAICYKREYMYPVTIGFFLILSFDLLLNGYYSISRYYGGMDDISETNEIGYFQQYYLENRDILDYIDRYNGDEGFYRVEKLYRRSHNDPMLLNYSGLSHFSSCESIDVKNFMRSLGFPTTSMWSYYGIDGSTAFLDSFFGIKYLISQYDETSKPYIPLSTIHEKYIFKNPYAYGLAFSSTEAIKDMDIDEYNVFAVQNELAKCITGEPYGMYRPVEIKDIKYENVEKSEKTYHKINPDDEAYIEFDMYITSNDFVYGYFSFEEPQSTRLTVNDVEKPPYFTYYDCGIRGIGYFDENTMIPVRVYLDQEQIEIENFDFYYESKEEIERFYNNASVSDIRTDKIKSSHLTVTADIAEGQDVLAFTLPYDEGWEITVDGKPAAVNKILSVLSAVDITPGKHTIELKFIPVGLLQGAMVSVAGLIILIALYIIERIRIRKLIKGD